MDELEILYQALHAEHKIGVVVEVSDLRLALPRFYKARADSGDPDLDRLQFRRSPYNPESELWIVIGPSKVQPQQVPA